MPEVEFRGDTQLRGEELVGREVLIRWKTGLFYDAVIVAYYEDEDEHKLVYRHDDGIEITRLTNRRWTLLAKRSSRDYKKPILDGAIIRFPYPKNGLVYKGMIYDSNSTGTIIKVAYLCEHSTDVLEAREWDFVRQSPCSLDVDNLVPLAVATMSSDSSDSSDSADSADAPGGQRRSNRSRPTEPGEPQQAVSVPLAVVTVSSESGDAPGSRRRLNRSRPKKPREAQQAVSSGRIIFKRRLSSRRGSS